MATRRNRPKRSNFNSQARLPFQLRLEDFEIAIEFAHELCTILERVLGMLCCALFDQRGGIFPGKARQDRLAVGGAVERKAFTDAGQRDQPLLARYLIDEDRGAPRQNRQVDGFANLVTQPARNREPMAFTEIYLAQVSIDDFRKNPRGELGTRTATLHREGVLKLRQNWIYKEKL